MKFAIDITLLKNDRVTGVEKYIKMLVTEILDVNKDHTIYLLCSMEYDAQSNFGLEQDSVIVLKSPFKNRILTDQLWIPYIARKNKIELIHFPVFGAPIFYRGKFVLTIHDATFWLYPDKISKGGRFYYKPLFPQAIRRAAKIIAVSESTKRDLINVFDLNENQIAVIYESLCKNMFSQIADTSVLKSQIDIVGNYILCVGTIEPRKNLQTYIYAFQILKEKYSIDIKLVIVGRKGWLTQIDIPSSIENDVVFTGFVEDSILARLYIDADLFVFPSIYEGFGFPILEANYARTPILASKNSSLIEVGKDCCMFVDDYLSPEAFAEKSYELLQNKNLSNFYVNKGIDNLKRFSWNECALETLTIYKTIVKSSNYGKNKFKG